VRVAPAVTYWGSPRALGRPPFASYSRATTRRIDVASLQAILDKGADDAIVWSVSTEAFDPRDLARVARNVATPPPRRAQGTAPDRPGAPRAINRPATAARDTRRETARD
jgi:hypothetical protein